MQCLISGDLESAAEIAPRLRALGGCPHLARLLADIRRLEGECRRAGEIREANRLKRRHRALSVFGVHGLDVERLLPSVRLPDGYEGKILLVAVFGGAAHGRTLLRCGDAWHREILEDARQEVADLGLTRAQVDAVGGAWVRFDADGAIAVWGASEEFGACDRLTAVDLIRTAYPQRPVRALD